MTKQELRKIYKAKRLGLPAMGKSKMDDLMLILFQQYDYGDIRTLLSYWPISAKGEPNSHIFSGYLRHIIPDLRICYPVAHGTENKMEAIAISEDTLFTTNALGVTEPKDGPKVRPEEIDLVLVPLLVCDKKGYRVGYGKGYYDRFLADCRKDIVKIGLSYFEPIDLITDTGHFDVPLTLCITPENCHEF